jgi:RNA polymerase sigma-70 factor (ECF subfamily)
MNLLGAKPEYQYGVKTLADDRELWERICQGDRRAFDAFYRMHGPKLEAFLRQILRNRQAAEDVMQETFTQIWQRPNGFQPSRGTLRAYLFGAGRKRAAEWWRKQEVLSTTLRIEPVNCKAETTSLVNDAFEHLPEEQRTLMWLREVEGQSYAELAEILEIPLGTVRSRLFAARENLRRVWQPAPKAKKEDA